MRNWLAVFIPCALLSAFLVLTSEVRDANAGQVELIGHIDEFVLRSFVNLRQPFLSDAAMDLTALGSGVVIVVVVALFSLILMFTRNFVSIGQLWIALLGAGLLTHFLKSYFERSRPEAALRLVEVQGFSYPSGHSLTSAAVYFSIWIVISRYFRGYREKSFLAAFFLSLIFVIGLTRIYLGVHYFSDVTAGILLGIALASLVDFAMRFKFSVLRAGSH